MTTSRTEREAKELRRQLHELAVALEGMAKAEGSEAIKSASGMAQRLAEQAGDFLAEFAHSAQATAERGGARVRDTICERPFTAIALAAGAGFLLAMLVRR